MDQFSVASEVANPFGLDERAILDGIRSWIEIESPTDVPEAMARMAAKIEADYGAFGARVDRILGRDGFGDHLLVTDARHCPPDRAAGQGILLLSHMDTVHPVGTIEDKLPFRIEGNRAYGPGAEDMKGGTYIAMAAVRRLGELGLMTNLPIRHLIVSDEEMGSPTSREYIEREARRAKFVLVTEPARLGGKIVTARKGIADFKVIARGVAAHAGAEHHLGRNAIRELARHVEAIERLTDYNREITVNVGTIQGGQRQNVVPDYAEMEVDCRFPNPETGEEILAAFNALKSSSEGVTIEVQGGVNRPGYEKSPGIAALYEHARCLAADLGFDLVDLKTGGGSDGNFTAAFAPTLDGLGVDGDGGHTLEERLYIDSIVPRTSLLIRLLETLE